MAKVKIVKFTPFPLQLMLSLRQEDFIGVFLIGDERLTGTLAALHHEPYEVIDTNLQKTSAEHEGNSSSSTLHVEPPGLFFLLTHALLGSLKELMHVTQKDACKVSNTEDVLHNITHAGHKHKQ